MLSQKSHVRGGSKIVCAGSENCAAYWGFQLIFNRYWAAKLPRVWVKDQNCAAYLYGAHAKLLNLVCVPFFPHLQLCTFSPAEYQLKLRNTSNICPWIVERFAVREELVPRIPPKTFAQSRVEKSHIFVIKNCDTSNCRKWSKNVS